MAGVVVGEMQQEKGADGARRAKRWMDSSLRVKSSWLNTSPAGIARTSFAWPHGGQSFSYDLGGLLRGGELDNHFFLAEVKKYKKALDQPALYDEFLAKSYVARSVNAMLGDHFMWITWAPFRATDWDVQCTPEQVRRGVLAHRTRLFGAVPEDEASNLVDSSLVEEVAERLWVIVLSDKQEQLSLSDDHRKILVAHEVGTDEGW